jgi:hypothetical protein
MTTASGSPAITWEETELPNMPPKPPTQEPTMTDNRTITLELTLDQAGALTKSVGKTLAAEQAKIARHGPGHVISRTAARDWQLLDDVDAQLRDQMHDEIKRLGDG